MHAVGLIPARGGSRRIPRKNVREVGGKPLIAHTIGQAADASVIDRCIVSTDDEEIATVARAHGGEVPFLRPAELATATASSADVVEHAIDWLESEGESPSIIVLLQVTTPLRTAGDINGAVERLIDDQEAESVVTVSRFQNPPMWALSMNDQGVLTPFYEEGILWSDNTTRSQDLPDLLYPNGAVFAVDVASFRDSHSFYTDRTLGYEIPPERSFDIDEPSDLEIVRALMAYHREL